MKSCRFVLPSTLLLSLTLAACSSPPPVDTAVLGEGGAIYLRPTTTRFSKSLDQLRAEDGSHKPSALPFALAAGDSEITVVGSLYRSGEVFGLDLVLRNHGHHPVRFGQSSIRLFDVDGHPIPQLLDWPEGAKYGLRARAFAQDDDAVETIPDALEPSPHPPTDLDKERDVSMKEAWLTPGASGTSPSEIIDWEWVRSLGLENDTVTEPERIELRPGQTEWYWSYFHGAHAHLPVMAVLEFGNKRIMMRFDDPQPDPANGS